MGCCCSRKKSSKEEDDKDEKSSKKGRSKKSVIRAISSRYGYEKTAASTDQSEVSAVSSRMAEAPTYQAMWPYQPVSKAELSIRMGDEFRLLGHPIGDLDPDWLFVMRMSKDGGRRWTGYVPRAYVGLRFALESEPWYFGPITGEEAEKLLKSMPTGSFLVRKRPLVQGCLERTEYALSIKHEGKIIHRPIRDMPVARPHGGRVYFLEMNGRSLKTIPLLIQFFMVCSKADLRKDKLPCQLTQWPQKPPPPRVSISIDAQKNWQEIPRSQITLGELKGDGHFGVVHAGTWNVDGKNIPVAVKALRKGSTRAKERFLREAVTMKNLRHKNLVRLYGIVSETKPFWIITEFVKEGSLLSYLSKRKARNELLSEKTYVLFQICDAMRYLEEKNVVHRDLAARNVLVSEERSGRDPVLQVKVADFGLARLVDPSTTQKSSKRGVDVPTKWTAPEALKNNQFSTASDVWSFGIVTHEVFTHGMEPYGILRRPAVRDRILKKRQILHQHASVPDKVYEMMKRCFDYDPQRRPTFQKLYNFFRYYYKEYGETSIGAE